MVKSHAFAPPQSIEQKRDANLRGWMNWLNAWRVCANTACERARCCRGQMSRCFPRLPQGVQDAFIALMQAREEGLPFDEAWDELEAVGLLDELGNWLNPLRGEPGASDAVH